MAEIIFSLKHYWRFVDPEPLELTALSQGMDGKTACTHTERRDRKSQPFYMHTAVLVVEDTFVPCLLKGGRLQVGVLVICGDATIAEG